MNNRLNTPLRYPGGKSVFTDFFTSYITANRLKEVIYVEPYCGGSGAAINLLLSNVVSQIWLNDADYSIYSFWYSLKYFGQEFLDMLSKTEINVKQWKFHREILLTPKNKSNRKADLLLNGFATFYLNRCNRSGILNAGPIGGQSAESQLAATYKIDARFNKKTLIEKVEAIIERRESIIVSNKDALDLLSDFSNQPIEFQEKSMIYLDPPYYKQGSSLYFNFYKHEDHKTIAAFLSKEFQWKWLLSYDNVNDIRNLYSSYPQYSFYINYSAQESKLGSELLLHSKNSILPESLLIRKMKKTNKRMELVLVE